MVRHLSFWTALFFLFIGEVVLPHQAEAARVKIVKYGAGKSTVIMNCGKQPCQFQRGDVVDMNWDANGQSGSFQVEVQKLSSDGKKAVSKVLKGGTLPPAGTIANVGFGGGDDGGNRSRKKSGGSKHDDSDSGSSWGGGGSGKTSHRWEIGAGTAYDSFFNLFIFDLRFQLAFFNFPLYLDLGLQPSFILYTNPSGYGLGIGIPVDVRYDYEVTSWLVVGPFIGMNIAALSMVSLSTTSETEMFSDFQFDFGGVIRINVSTWGLYVRASKETVIGGFSFAL